ncbi:hypothetical protein Snoj_52890 [Streptomyces nojiriensis]|uniref:Uncharacterized protein n=1 Tax=Streptomyces nojiriensis TaxID=66374 RepID=A0ABQ3STE2_9ACTN|nr:hypothetical protein GCM10010205_21130 [Streptomyces nojiriensis]GHI71371.1 hypothetical protein Snoj_52890 [Streptomyces nojiriensis]
MDGGGDGADAEGVARGDGVDAAIVAAEGGCDRGCAVHLQPGLGFESGGDELFVEVVEVFVGDQDGVSPGDGLCRVRGEGAGVDDQAGAVLLERDAGMGVLGELHSGSFPNDRMSTTRLYSLVDGRG